MDGLKIDERVFILYNIGWASGFLCLYRLSLFIRASSA